MKSASLLCLALALLNVGAPAARAEIVIPGGRAVLRLSEAAIPLSLVLTADNTECLDRTRPEPLAEVQTPDGIWHGANAARKDGDTLVLGFRDTDATLTLAVETPPDWIALRVAAFGGTRPAAVRFIKLDSAFNEIVGKRLNIGWNNAHALCVMATSPLTDTQVAGQTLVTLDETVAAINRGEGGVNPRVCLTASTQDAPGPKMEGAAAAIIACPTPEFKAVARRVAHAYGLLTNETADGTPVKDTDLARGSYFLISAGLSDVDALIRYCTEAGIRQVMLSADAWCSSVGHYTINTNTFPQGLADLKTFVARLKAAGITAGMHVYGAKLNGDSVGQESALPGETHARLAEIFNTCGFGMVYFDGGEDADRRRFDYYVSTFQTGAMRRFNRPAIHLGAIMTHRLWHSFARSSTVDTYLNTLGGAILAGQPPEKWPTVKQHIDTSVAHMLSLRGDMMPGELGWFGVWPRQTRFGREVGGLQIDELEYLLCRSVAFDCPVSLQTSFSELAQHPLTPELLRLFKAYETARLGRRFSEADKAPMREPGKEFILLQIRGGDPAFAAARPVPCGESRNTHAMVGAFEKGAVATFWNEAGGATVTLDVSPDIVRVADFDDQRVVVQKSADGKLVLPVAVRRLTLLCPTLDAATLEQKIKNSLSTTAAAVYK